MSSHTVSQLLEGIKGDPSWSKTEHSSWIAAREAEAIAFVQEKYIEVTETNRQVPELSIPWLPNDLIEVLSVETIRSITSEFVAWLL